MAGQDWALAKELLRFLYSLDHTGAVLKTALASASAPQQPVPPLFARSNSAPSTWKGANFADLDPDSPEISRSPSTPLQSTAASANGRVDRQQFGLGLGSLLSRVGMGTQPADYFRNHRSAR